MPNWPATLPQFVLEEGFMEQLLTAKVESPNDQGTVKMRRRFTKDRRKLNVTLAMTPAQKTAFEAFYVTTLLGGTLSFTWVDPVSQAARDFVFRDPAPAFNARSGSGGQEIRARFVLETAP